MADTQTVSKVVSMVAEFTDGDTRTITQNNPSTNQQELIAAINNFNSYVAANQILIGDKAGGAYMRIKEAKVRNTTQVKFDLG